VPSARGRAEAEKSARPSSATAEGTTVNCRTTGALERERTARNALEDEGVRVAQTGSSAGSRSR